LPVSFLALAAQTIVVALAASVLCDCIHALLHLAQRAPAPLSWPSKLHRAHHRFLDERLAFHPERFWLNVLMHQVPETVMRLVVVVALAAAFDVSPDVVMAVAAVVGAELAIVVARRGHDAFHRDERPVPPPRAGAFVDAAYHAHHHAFPDHFWGAHLQVLDRAFGRLLPLKGRDVVVVGGSRYCQALVEALSEAGARVTRHADDAVSDEALGACDVLVLGHGAHHRDGRAYEVLMTRALQAREAGAHLLPLDVWAVADDEAWRARRGAFADRAIIRVLVRGPMLGARATLFWLSRGARVL